MSNKEIEYTHVHAHLVRRQVELYPENHHFEQNHIGHSQNLTKGADVRYLNYDITTSSAFGRSVTSSEFRSRDSNSPST